MYILIDTDKFEVYAKHPNWMALHELGIICCPESTLVTPLNDLTGLDDVDLQMLYINLTDNLGAAPYDRETVERILFDYFTQLPETILDHTEVARQAEFCLEYDVQGYCSFQPGAVVPSMEEGLWKPARCQYNAERENSIISGSRVICEQPALQASWTPGRGAKS
ncbi:hypothetical protein OMDBNIEC_00028 [Salmonella phage STP-SP5]|nr:hypothetical protein OMDBNIEC_00028 [Salmonella phage STP-SP5]